MVLIYAADKIIQTKKPNVNAINKKISFIVFGLLLGCVAAIGYNTAIFLQKISWMPVKHIVTESRKARHSTDDSEYVSVAWKSD